MEDGGTVYNYKHKMYLREEKIRQAELLYQVPDSVSLSLTESMSKGSGVDVDLSVVDGLVGRCFGTGLFRRN